MQATARPLLSTAALGVALLLCAGLLDAEPLYVPGAACVLLAAGAAAWVLGGARGLRVSREVDRRRVVEDEPVRMVIAVRSPRMLPTGGVLDDLLPEPWPLAAGRRRSEASFDVRFGRRGRKRLAAPRVAVRDPFGLLTRIVRDPAVAAAEVLVLPRVEPVAAAPAAAGADGRSLALRRGTPPAAEAEIDGVRPLREGTPASRLYWPSLAKGGDLLERHLRADSDTRPLLVLDPRGAAAEEDLDAAVRATASLAVELARHGGCAVLLPGERRPAALEPSLATWPQLHARLALIRGDEVPATAPLAGRRGPVVFVSARRLTRPPRALGHAPGGGRILVVPAAIPGRRVAFTVAGCWGHEVSAPRRATAGAAA
ncbi:MAG TPA: DUF58 domain-containing protein [Baekduia sp.]|nr:DUF58 domain-containing protein [Baekduia sp.]